MLRTLTAAAGAASLSRQTLPWQSAPLLQAVSQQFQRLHSHLAQQQQQQQQQHHERAAAQPWQASSSANAAARAGPPQQPPLRPPPAAGRPPPAAQQPWSGPGQPRGRDPAHAPGHPPASHAGRHAGQPARRRGHGGALQLAAAAPAGAVQHVLPLQLQQHQGPGHQALLRGGGGSSIGSSFGGGSGTVHTRGIYAKAYHAQHSEYKMESLLMFDSCWRRFEERYGMDFRVPREVVWVNGAPGSGKGVNTQHILKTRGLTKHFTISGLLESYPDARRLIEAGEMIPDTLVGDLLLEALLLDEPGLQDDLGFVVDGFPRTACQVDFLKMLYDKMVALHHQYADTPRSIAFPRPSFKVVILYVDEETSIKRQLQRARVANLHNRRVLDAGAGHFFEERSTDTDIDKCRKRYAIFKTHYAATLRLKNYFPFTLIDAMGSIEETRQQITRELRYQSSLDLSATTYELIRHLPLAKEVVLSARQELVMRLDGYCEASLDLFEEVIDRIINDVLPVVRQSGLAGHAEYVTRSAFFSDNPVAIDMLVDVLTDRGFHVCYIREDTAVPERLDAATGVITTLLKPCHKFRISFDARGPRDDIKALEIAARMAESNATLQRDIRISHSVIPEHFGEDEDEEEGDEGGGGGDGGGDEDARTGRQTARVVGFMGS